MAYSSDEKKALVKRFSNRSRKAAIVGNRLIAPRLFDGQGDPLPPEKTIEKPYSFNLREAAFLVAVRDSDGDIDVAIQKSGVDAAWAKRFLKRKSAGDFLSEDQHYGALAQIASLPWVKGKITAAVIGEEQLNETQKWGLERLEKINNPKISVNQFNTQTNNFYQMPELPPAQQEEARKFFDTLADTPDVANG
jgi:hypothetical protein